MVVKKFETFFLKITKMVIQENVRCCKILKNGSHIRPYLIGKFILILYRVYKSEIAICFAKCLNVRCFLLKQNVLVLIILNKPGK